MAGCEWLFRGSYGQGERRVSPPESYPASTRPALTNDMRFRHTLPRKGQGTLQEGGYRIKAAKGGGRER